MNVVPIAVACAAAGIVSGILSYTGLGSKISTLIVNISGGIPFIALFFTMIFSIIIGMGLPTTAAYLILASVVAPALAKLGIPILSAHLFVFYFGLHVDYNAAGRFSVICGSGNIRRVCGKSQLDRIQIRINKLHYFHTCLYIPALSY